MRQQTLTPDERLAKATGLLDGGIIQTLAEADELEADILKDWQKLKKFELPHIKDVAAHPDAFTLFSLAWLRGYSQHVNKSRTPPDTTYIG